MLLVYGRCDQPDLRGALQDGLPQHVGTLRRVQDSLLFGSGRSSRGARALAAPVAALAPAAPFVALDLDVQ